MLRYRFLGIILVSIALVLVFAGLGPQGICHGGPTSGRAAVLEEAWGFSAENAMKHVRELSNRIGRRVSGTNGEQRAADYIKEEFIRLGYSVSTQTLRLPNGRASRNVIAHKVGSFHPQKTVVVGAHMDTKGRSPGANDNASGVAVVLELSRVLKDRDTPLGVEFVAFGAEERIDKNKDHHHYGSRYFVSSLRTEEKSSIVGMVSIDGVGVGNSLYIQSLGLQPLTFVNHVIECGKQLGAKVSYLKGPEWSDHEAFEKAGIFAAWVQYQRDPNNHTRRDTGRHIGRAQLQTAGDMILRFVTTYSGI